MNDSIYKYLNKSKSNLNIILSNLESNIEFLDNDLWDNYSDIKDVVNEIINIYSDKYYLSINKDYSKINKYIKFNNKINRKLKNILLAIIEYFESINEENIIRNKEGSILYLTILIYISLTLYEKDFNKINDSKKIEKVINNVIDNFARIRFKREKDLVGLLSNIKSVVEENNRFNDCIDDLNTDESHNMFISINKENKYYKVLYEYNINSLKDYDDKDIKIVNNKMNILNVFSKISYEMCYYTVFKLLKNGKNYTMLFPINKGSLIDENKINEYLEGNEEIKKQIKFLIDYNEIIDDYDFINFIKEKEIDLYIEVNGKVETNNYNMFMDMKNIIVTEEFLSVNERYLEIWKDMGLNFIIKNMGDRLNEKSLINRK